MTKHFQVIILRKLVFRLMVSLSLISSCQFAAAQPLPTTPTLQTVIKLPQWQAQLQYQQSPHLATVLTDIQQQLLLQNPKQSMVSNYHEGYQLFNLDKQASADKLYQQVLSQLSNLAKQSPEYATDVVKIRQQLGDFNYAYREKLNLDADAVRLKESLNPKLTGHYLFKTTPSSDISVTTKRPIHIQILGLVEPQGVPFDSVASANDYLQLVPHLQHANTNQVWLIAPNGDTTKVGYANWNQSHQHLLPGTTIWLGFAKLTPVIEQLELNIVNLLSMRTSQAPTQDHK